MLIDYKKYPPNWKQTRARILERAGNCCEKCGVPNYALIYRPGYFTKCDWLMWPEGMAGEALTEDGFKATKIILTIAHLDHDADNHSVTDDRLMAMCQLCHLRYDAPYKARKRRKAKKDEQQTTLEL